MDSDTINATIDNVKNTLNGINTVVNGILTSSTLDERNLWVNIYSMRMNSVIAILDTVKSEPIPQADVPLEAKSAEIQPCDE